MSGALRRRPPARVAGAVLLVAAAAALAATAVAEGDRGRAQLGSAVDPGPRGLLVWSELLRLGDHPVEVADGPPHDAGLDPGGTAILVGPEPLEDDDADALRSFLDDGGRLVIAGPRADDRLREIAGLDVVRGSVGWGSAEPVAPAPEVAGVGSASAGAGVDALSDPGEALPALASQAGAWVAVADVGSGRLVLLADADPVRNERIAIADNAALAVGVVGEPGRPVRFVEPEGAVPSATGLAALPSRWGFAAAGLLLAALVAVAARWRRLGPPERASRPLPPPRHDYVEAMASSLARAREPAAVAAPLRSEALAELERRTGARPDQGADRVRAAARSIGLDAEQAEALAEPPEGERGLIAVAGAMAALSSRIETR